LAVNRRYIWIEFPRARRASISTIKKIAGLAGVSIGTVDRVLHKRGRVSPVTEARILRISKDLKYKPNVFARNLKLAKTFVFGVLMPRPDQDSGYWTLPLKGVDRAEAELRSQKIRIRRFFYDKHSAASIGRANRKALAAGLDGLLIAPVGSPPFERFIRNLQERLPFVFFDSFIPDTAFLASIGQDSYQSGVLSARLMQMLVNQPGHMAIINVMPRDYHIEDRVRGFLTYCRRCPHITSEVYEVDGDKGRGGLSRVLDRVFRRHPDIRGIFVTNANTHPAAAYIKSRSAAGKVHIIGYDLIDENVLYLREGTIDFLISQQPERQGYEGIVALYRHVVLKEPVPKKVMMQIDIVTSDNVDFYRS
jgi:LacI family transcriptional regulator